MRTRSQRPRNRAFFPQSRYLFTRLSSCSPGPSMLLKQGKSVPARRGLRLSYLLCSRQGYDMRSRVWRFAGTECKEVRQAFHPNRGISSIGLQDAHDLLKCLCVGKASVAGRNEDFGSRPIEMGTGERDDKVAFADNRMRRRNWSCVRQGPEKSRIRRESVNACWQPRVSSRQGLAREVGHFVGNPARQTNQTDGESSQAAQRQPTSLVRGANENHPTDILSGFKDQATP